MASSYLCLESNFNVTLFLTDWMNNTGYFEILIKITNLSMLNSTMNLIKLQRPTFELIWSALSLKLIILQILLRLLLIVPKVFS